jgi:cyclophilin family peptidyl-prolyl cis-trans isomerase
MLKKFSLIFSLTMVCLFLSANTFAQGDAVRVKITTDSGIMIVRLYDSTPLHRDNFVKLVKSGFYDSLLFHRVIPGFMIQGGDPLSKNAPAGVMLGNGGADMQRIPAEFRPGLFHKKGALAAARDGNPEKASSACQFYIVEGAILSDSELDMLESRKGKKYSPEQRSIYKTIGGTPFLDQDYTVFGEVESGLDVVHKIASAPRDASNRPLGDIHMRMELIK